MVLVEGLLARFRKPQTPEGALVKEILEPDVAIFTYPQDTSNHDVAFGLASHLVIGALDGAGSYPTPEEAAVCGSRALQQEHRELPRNASLRQVIKHSQRSMRIAHDAVRNNAKGEKEGMRAAAVTARLCYESDGSIKLVVAWVGDCDAYVGNEEELRRITSADDGIKDIVRDPQKVDEMRNAIDEADSEEDLEVGETYKLRKSIWIMKNDGEYVRTKELTIKDFFNNQHQVTQFLGGKRIRVNVVVADVKPGDVVLVTTDGVNNLRQKEKAEIVKEQMRQDPRARSVVDGLGGASVNESIETWFPGVARPDAKTVGAMIVPPHPNATPA